MCRPSAPDVFGMPFASRVSSSSRIHRATSRTRFERHAVRGIQVERRAVGCLRIGQPREPWILRDRRELRHVEERLEGAADDVRARFGDRDHLDRTPGGMSVARC